MTLKRKEKEATIKKKFFLGKVGGWVGGGRGVLIDYAHTFVLISYILKFF